MLHSTIPRDVKFKDEIFCFSRCHYYFIIILSAHKERGKLLI